MTILNNPILQNETHGKSVRSFRENLINANTHNKGMLKKLWAKDPSDKVGKMRCK